MTPVRAFVPARPAAFLAAPLLACDAVFIIALLLGETAAAQVASPKRNDVAMELAEAAADVFFRTPYEPGWKKTVRPGALTLTAENNLGGAVWFIDQDRDERCIFHVLQLSYRHGEDAFRWDQSVVIDARAIEHSRLEASATEVTFRARKPRLICWRYPGFGLGQPARGASAVRHKCDDEHVSVAKFAEREHFESAVSALQAACGWR